MSYSKEKWYFDDRDATVCITRDENELEICRLSGVDFDTKKYQYGSETRANSRLITSAPALLEALEECVADLWYQISSNHGPEKATKHNSIVKARAAIAAARGE